MSVGLRLVGAKTTLAGARCLRRSFNMGCFDTYIFECPWCGKEVREQVKPGYMNTYRFGEDLEQDVEMEGHYTCYDGCGKNFYVKFETSPKMVIVKDET